ncbi:MAG: diguanylate cyclase [Gemmatimonadetes bacterium]|nr:diguanylate cyclase [Gemmatimonadota bacterium]
MAERRASLLPVALAAVRLGLPASEGAQRDALIEQAIALVAANLRGDDRIARDDDDVLLLLPGAGAREAYDVSIRLAAAVRGHPFAGMGGGGEQITLASGIAAVPEHPGEVAHLIQLSRSARDAVLATGGDGAAIAPTRSGEQPERPLDIERFAGRAEQRNSLVHALDDAVQGRPRVVAVLGELGFGTAALIRQLEPEIRLRGGSLVTGHARESDVRAPYGVWAEVLNALRRLPDPPQRSWRELQHLVPALVLDGATVEERTGSKYRLLEEVSDYIRLVAEGRPLVLVLDDMHWADDVSWDMLEHLIRQLDGERVLLCLTLRTDPAFVESAERLQALVRGDLVQELRLSRLTRDEVKRWLEAVLHHQMVGRELLAFLYRHTEGNPFFVAQLLRTLIEEGALWQGVDQWEWTPVSELRFPPGLTALLARRLGRLSSSTQAVLTAAAVVGRAFDVGLVVQSGAGSEPAVRLALSEGIAAGVLHTAAERRGGTYRFAHEAMASVLLGTTPPEQRRQLHERVAQVLERRGSIDATEVAMHWDRALRAPDAYRSALRAAIHAESVYAHSIASALLQVAVRNAGSPAELAETRVRLAQIAEALGRYDEAEELCDLAIEWFAGQGDQRRALTLRRMRERARKELGQPAPITLEALQALDVEAARIGLDTERVAILTLLSQTYGRLGDPASAERIATETVAMAERIGDPSLLAEALNRLAITLENEAPARARENYQRALQIFQAAGDVRGQARCWNNLGIVGQTEMRVDEAREALTTAIALARAAGMPDLWGTAALNLGVMANKAGDYDRARELFGEALALFAAVKNSELQLYALYNMANVERERGAFDSASELYEATSSLAKRIGAADVEIGALAGEGLCHLEMGRLDVARGPLKQMEARLGDRSDWFQGRELVETFRVRLAVAEGEPDIALERFRTAHAMAEGADLYSAAWLTAACADVMMPLDPEGVRARVGSYGDRVESLGYIELTRRYQTLLGSG